jgi:hypothetical protein
MITYSDEIIKAGKAPEHGIWLYSFNNKRCVNEPGEAMNQIQNSSNKEQNQKDVPPLDAEELYRRYIRMCAEKDTSTNDD